MSDANGGPASALRLAAHCLEPQLVRSWQAAFLTWATALRRHRLTSTSPLAPRDRSVRTPQALRLAACLTLCIACRARAQTVELPKCDSDTLTGKVTTFQVRLPLPPQRAYGRVVRAFIQVGLTPSNAASISGQVYWNSGTETNFWGDNHARRITATVVEEDDDQNATLVIIAPYEATSEGLSDGHSMRPLSNRNGGYGKKVWCAAAAISDTLRAAAARLASRPAGTAAAPPDTSTKANDSTPAREQ